ncbi:MAG: FtsX-like permease family protein [Microscillaceae bacterium]|nr:FtsX-like permease family protein [Microscillaceae bacterium]
MKNIIHYAILSLLRRWRKQLGLTLIYALVVAFYASIIFFIASLRYETQVVLQNIPELWVQKVAGGRLVPMQTDFLDSLKNIRGVRQIIPRVWGYNFDSPTGAVFTVMGSDSLLQGLKMVNSPQKTILNNQETLVGTGFLELRGLQLGESLTLLDNRGKIHSFKIVGVFTADSDLLTRDLIILSPASARLVLGLGINEITDVALSIYNPAEVDNIGRKLDRRFAGVRVVTASQLRATYETLFGWRGGVFVYGSVLAIFAFLILAWERAGGLSREEKQELGVLKAVGWQISDVLWLKFWEACIVSFTATLLGIVLALWHVFVWQAPLLKPFLIGWSVLYPDYQLVPVVDIQSLLAVFALSVIPYLTATLVPAWRGAITDPAEVMQGG